MEMNHAGRIVIVGATSAIAEHCARLWLQSGSVDMTLIGRDESRLQRLVADLRVRSPDASIRAMTAQFLDASAIQATVDGIVAQGAVELALIAQGALPAQADCQNNLRACHDALAINGLSPVLYAEAFAKHMANANCGTVAIIGSVAGDRGRKSNYVYGAAKGMLARYAQGLQHRFAGTGVQVLLLKPGPTDTPMTAHLKVQGAKLAAVEDVARDIVQAIRKGQRVAYVPGRWRLIMLVLMHLPSFIFNKMNI